MLDGAHNPAGARALAQYVGRFYAEAYGMTVMTTRMFTHTGPRRGDVFAESTFAKQIAMIEHNRIPPVVKVGNLQSLRTVADVRDAVRAYFMLVTVNPVAGAYYNIGGTHSCTVKDILDTLISYSPLRDAIRVEVDPDRLRPIDADLQVPNTAKFRAQQLCLGIGIAEGACDATHEALSGPWSCLVDEACQRLATTARLTRQ